MTPVVSIPRHSKICPWLLRRFDLDFHKLEAVCSKFSGFLVIYCHFLKKLWVPAHIPERLNYYDFTVTFWQIPQNLWNVPLPYWSKLFKKWKWGQQGLELARVVLVTNNATPSTAWICWQHFYTFPFWKLIKAKESVSAIPFLTQQ